MRKMRISYRLVMIILSLALFSGSIAAHAEVTEFSGGEFVIMHGVEIEDNNSFETASEGITAFYNWGLLGNLESKDDKDYFKLTFSEDTMIQFQLFNEKGPYEANHWNLTLFRADEEGIFIPFAKIQFGTYYSIYMNPIRLSAGDYYFLVDYQGEGCEYTEADYFIRCYNFPTFVGQDKYEKEFNDTAIAAQPVKLGNEYSGNFNSADDVDYYTFNISKKMNVLIFSEKSESGDASFNAALLSGNKGKIKEISSYTFALNTRDHENVELDAGTYYLKLTQKGREPVYPDYKIMVAENKPSTPVNLTSDYDIMDGITLSWEEADQAVAYCIYRSTNKSSGYKKLATVTYNAYSDRCFSPGKTYYYKVKAINRDLYESSFSKVLTVKTSKETYPPYWRTISITALQKENGIYEKLIRDAKINKDGWEIYTDCAFYYSQESYKQVLQFALYDKEGYKYHFLDINVKNDDALYISKLILEYYYPKSYDKVLKKFMQWYKNGKSCSGTYDSRQFKCDKSGCYIGVK